jgi:hypothetical protein
MRRIRNATTYNNRDAVSIKLPKARMMGVERIQVPKMIRNLE